MSARSSTTFHGRSLPRHLIDYRSKESQTRLCRAFARGSAIPYLPLSSCFNSQAEPAYCGLTTLAIILNSLRIDPQRVWKTIWRWYTEDLLDCCRPLEDVKVSGITLEEFVCLANCNGAVASLVRPSDSEDDFQKFVAAVERVCTGGRSERSAKDDDNGEIFDEENPEEFIAVSFSRKTLSQTGDGHFSPLAALDKETNSVLVFDTARFKYPPYWVPLELLFKALLPLDEKTNKTRGYVVLKAKHEYQGGRVCCIWRELSSGNVSQADLPEPNPVYRSGHCCSASCKNL